MEYRFKQIKLSNAEKLWLTKISRLNFSNVDAKHLRVELWEEIPEDFDPKAIDSRLIRDNRLTLIGLWYIDPQNPIFSHVSKTIETIKALIQRHSDTNRIKAKEIAQLVGITEREMEIALMLIYDLGGFFGSASKSNTRKGFQEVGFTENDSAYNEFLKFKNLERKMEQFFISHAPSSNIKKEKSAENNVFNITLRIDNKPIETMIEIITEGPEIVNLSYLGGDYDISYPYAIVSTLSKPKLILSAESSSGRVPKDVLKEFLLFVTPRTAEIIINREYAKVSGWGFSPLVETVECNDFGIKTLKDIPDTDKNLSKLIRKDPYFHSVKEDIAGETYDQRSRLYYEDLCRFIVKIWRSPHSPTKQVYPGEFRLFNENRRIYENNEVNNVFEWAIGDDYLIEVRPKIETRSTSIYAMRRLIGTFWKINGSKIRELEQKLSKDELGILPQIVGQINLNKELDFISNGNLRAMIERDCKEVNAAARIGAAKSVIVLCGSIVEALLYDLLKTNEVKVRQIADKLASKSLLPKKPPKELNQWTAEPMILVSHEMYPKKVAEDACKFADVLRNYRNLIHPGKEDREKITFDQNIASIAISVVNLIISGLER